MHGRLIGEEGLVFHGIKYEHGVHSVVAAKGNSVLYQGINFARFEKGEHQLLQRELVDTKRLGKWWGGGRKTPWLWATGQRQQYEVPMRMMTIGGQAGERILGDSAIAFTSIKAAKFAAMYPEGRVEKLIVPLSRTLEGRGPGAQLLEHG